MIGCMFSGYGGLSMAVSDVLGMDVGWHAEIEPAACRVLAHHWPDVPNLGDVSTTDWEEVRHMGAHQNDVRAQEMYDRYCQGLSLAEVGEEFNQTRQSVYDKFKRRGWDLRPKPKPLPHVTFNGRKYSMRNTGYYGCTTGERQLLHRDVWEHHRGAIPDGWDIHHRDHNKTNNDIANLECLPKDEHARRYGTGCNQFRHGCDKEVMPGESAVEVITAGFP